MSISLRQLEAFMALAGLQSFTAAGKALYITQSAISGLIRELEQHVGTALFNRSSRVVTLSREGERFYPIVKKMFNELQIVEKYATELKHISAGLVRIAGAPLMACTILPVLMAAFVRHEPRSRVEIIDQPMRLVQQELLTGGAEIGFGPERLLQEGVKAETLFSTNVSMLSRPDHPLAVLYQLSPQSGGVLWEQVKTYPLIAAEWESISKVALDLGGKQPFRIATMANNMPTALALAASGHGVVVAGEFSMLLAKGYGLVITPIIKPVLVRKMQIYFHESRPLSEQASSFVKFARRFVRKHNPNTMGDSTVARLSSLKA